MIRVETISVQEFRGIRNLTIDCKGQNFAICGPNGTGKSGIVDALEFALTGNISRLSGKGTGGVSVKEHAPHVDSRKKPELARIVLCGSIPGLGKTFRLERSVKTASSVLITPDDPDVVRTLERVANHPEFALSRRELIRYVLSAPGDRAKEVQSLLRLDQVETVRGVLNKITNSCQRESVRLERDRQSAEVSLSSALGVSDVAPNTLLGAVNPRRALLNLIPLAVLDSTTSLRDGLAAAAASTASPRVPKAAATADLNRLREAIARIRGPEAVASCARATERLSALSADPTVAQSVSREQFLQSALGLIDNEECPLCDTPWDADELRELIGRKLQHLDEVTRQRAEAEKEVEPIITALKSLQDALANVAGYGPLLRPSVEVDSLREFGSAVMAKLSALNDVLPLPASIAALQDLTFVPEQALETVAAIDAGVAGITEPSDQDTARDYLTVGQERLEAYRAAFRNHQNAEEHATVTRKVYEAYGRASTELLDGLYNQVEERFSDLYRFINHDDEGGFTAHLTPSIGKLGFDVDFYGRGMFPPGAYHSEGHQDGMGLCLYLALMSHLLRDSFTFAVLDDVLMSVDSGHRREVCKLLKERFPATQFILTTHDDIWLRHMRTAGLISTHAFIHFRSWDVARGPTEWDGRDIWDEADGDLNRNDVRSAAALLRHYLEFLFTEICHRLRAPVEFRGDAQFLLGDLLPAATARFRSLLKEGKAAAESWGSGEDTNLIAAREAEFATLVAATYVDQWQVNAAVHYNEWANLQKSDFAGIVQAFRSLLNALSCANPICGSLLYVVPERGPREALRCTCGVTNINLRRKKIDKLSHLGE